MAKVTKKLEEIKEYRKTRNVSADNEFMITITTNLLKSISVRSNHMHLLLKSYKEQKRKIDSNLEIAIGTYICSLVTCWETFFRDLFIFISNNDNTICKKLCAEVSETIPLGLTIGEFYARKYNFQNLNNTREAFDYIFQMIFLMKQCVLVFHLFLNGFKTEHFKIKLIMYYKQLLI